MNILRIIITTFSILLLISCTYTHNTKEDGANALGGGINVSEITPDKFWIVAKTNFAAWENPKSMAKSMGSDSIDFGFTPPVDAAEHRSRQWNSSLRVCAWMHMSQRDMEGPSDEPTYGEKRREPERLHGCRR